jgi:CheY-like chemotaxis protein
VGEGLTGKLLLVVDDDADNAEVLAYILEGAGAEVRTAGSAREVLDLVAGTWRPDALLLDISLPDMDGYALLEAIRVEPRWHDIPAVAVTGHAYDTDKQRSTEAGFAAHVAKPFEGPEVVALLTTLTAERVSPISGLARRTVDETEQAADQVGTKPRRGSGR